MGGGAYSGRLYSARSADRKATGTDDFAYSGDTLSRSRSDWAAHKDLDPKGIHKSVTGVRESRDSKEHPVSMPVLIMFDVTGSMGSVPQKFQKNLNELMSTLTGEGDNVVKATGKTILAHPQILIGGIGDATVDSVPLQVSQFESDNRIDEHLRKLVLEGGGGGHITESYELALYFSARLTAMDCVDKRKRKGYLFLSGDEIPYDVVDKKQVKKVFGITEKTDIKLSRIWEEVNRKFVTHFIIPNYTNHANDPRITKAWEKYTTVLRLQDPNDLSNLISSTIAAHEASYKKFTACKVEQAPDNKKCDKCADKFVCWTT